MRKGGRVLSKLSDVQWKSARRTGQAPLIEEKPEEERLLSKLSDVRRKSARRTGAAL